MSSLSATTRSVNLNSIDNVFCLLSLIKKCIYETVILKAKTMQRSEDVQVLNGQQAKNKSDY